MKLYNFPFSGNCYKVRLLLNQLEIPFEKIDVKLFQQETQLPEFLAKNPSGKVPVLEIDSETFLSESSAILTYLARDTKFFPSDRLPQTEILKWLFFEQFSLAANLGRPRVWMKVMNQTEQMAPMIAYHQKLGNAALQVVEDHLTQHSFFVNENYTIADIAIYGYVHVADEAGYDMSQFPAIGAWCDRVRSQPNHITISEDKKPVS